MREIELGCLLAVLTGCTVEEGVAPLAPEPEAPVSYDLAPPPSGEGFQVDLGLHTIEPGVEAGHCLRLPVPREYAGADAYVTGFESRFSAGTHHYFMSYGSEPGVVEEPTPCYGSEALVEVDDGFAVPEEFAEVGAELSAAKFLLGTGQGAYASRLPSGYGLHLDDGQGFLLSSWHILNTGSEPADVFGILNVFAKPQTDIAHPVRALNCLLRDVTVEPHSVRTVTATCTVPFDLDLVLLGSHAHQYLVRFEARIFDGATASPEPLYVSTDWDSPALVMLAEPLALRAGQGITFTCHYDNPTDQLIVFGGGTYGEMCASMNGYAYPADQPYELPPTLGTIVFTDGGTGALVDTTDIDGPF